MQSIQRSIPVILAALILGCGGGHGTGDGAGTGDQVVNVCESLQLLQTKPDRPALPEIQRMADLVCQMLDDTIAAYFDNDADKAELTRSHDDLVDALNAQVIKKLLSDEVLHEVLTGTQDIADALAQILVARHLERIADQAVNICKEVIYVVRGEDVRHVGEHATQKATNTPGALPPEDPSAAGSER